MSPPVFHLSAKDDFTRWPLPERALSGFLALSRQSAESSGERPALLVCWPWASRNAFQQLLYGEAEKSGFLILPIKTLDELEQISWPGPIVLHAHWFSQLYAGVKDAQEAEAAGVKAMEQVVAFRSRTGAKLLWTAHNVFPHRVPYREATLRLRREVLSTFDAVHLMADNHRAILEEAYNAPLERSFVVPHPLYTGAYPDTVSREHARAYFGLEDETSMFLSFGAVHAYKGFDLLLRAFAMLPDNSRLVVAGRAADPAVAEMLRIAAAKNPGIVIKSEYVTDEDIQLYFRAADALIIPYTDGLNSGAAWLGVTFDLPVVVPDVPAFMPVRQISVGRSYVADTAKSLATAMVLAKTGEHPIKDLSARAPEAVSRQFFGAVRALLKSPLVSPQAINLEVAARNGL